MGSKKMKGTPTIKGALQVPRVVEEGKGFEPLHRIVHPMSRDSNAGRCQFRSAFHFFYLEGGVRDFISRITMSQDSRGRGVRREKAGLCRVRNRHGRINLRRVGRDPHTIRDG